MKIIRFTTLENLNDSEDIHSAWENIKEKLKKSGSVRIEAA